MKEALPIKRLELQSILSYTNTHSVTRRTYLANKLFPCVIFFLLVSLSRVRKISYLRAITATSSYGVGDTDNTQRILKFIRIIISRSALLLKMDTLSHLLIFYTNMRNLLSDQWFSWIDIDDKAQKSGCIY